ncbi:MAG: hypothetical protein DMF84_28085 [Acidobacteria bacterium]|nr:MAG: hypothetical protein DMF84_28085 [Acidobacteriota bacterium]
MWRALRHSEAAGFTQEELATIAGLSVHAVSALERGERRRPHVETARALSAAVDLTGPTRDVLRACAGPPAQNTPVDELSGVPLPLVLTVLLGRDADVQTLRLWLADPEADAERAGGGQSPGRGRMRTTSTRVTVWTVSTVVSVTATDKMSTSFGRKREHVSPAPRAFTNSGAGPIRAISRPLSCV